jgi:hypothetical protein
VPNGGSVYLYATIEGFARELKATINITNYFGQLRVFGGNSINQDHNYKSDFGKDDYSFFGKLKFDFTFDLDSYAGSIPFPSSGIIGGYNIFISEDPIFYFHSERKHLHTEKCSDSSGQPVEYSYSEVETEDWKLQNVDVDTTGALTVDPVGLGTENNPHFNVVFGDPIKNQFTYSVHIDWKSTEKNPCPKSISSKGSDSKVSDKTLPIWGVFEYKKGIFNNSDNTFYGVHEQLSDIYFPWQNIPYRGQFFSDSSYYTEIPGSVVISLKILDYKGNR